MGDIELFGILTEKDEDKYGFVIECGYGRMGKDKSLDLLFSLADSNSLLAWVRTPRVCFSFSLLLVFTISLISLFSTI
jgi:hypothetical protein